MSTRIRGIAAIAAFAGSGIAGAAEPYTEHTFRLSEGESSPEVTVDAAAMLAGGWFGTAFGQRFEETWNPPSAGTMVGLFKLFGDDGVTLYEIELITVEDGALTLKVRHFNADFSAWEDRTESVDFRLARLGDGELHFEGLSFYGLGKDRMDVYLVMRTGDGAREEHIVYQRTRERK